MVGRNDWTEHLVHQADRQRRSSPNICGSSWQLVVQGYLGFRCLGTLGPSTTNRPQVFFAL
jgi:hypothetical protein